MRAAYAALLLGIIGGLGLATVVFSGRIIGPMTLADSLGIEPPTADLDRRRAEAVAVLLGACMARQGLRWEPIAEAPPAVPDAELGPVAWAERWGFGVSTMVGRSQPSAAVDPNLSRLETAGALERDAYRRALHGDGRGRGCMAVATSAVYELRDRLLRPLAEDLAALQARILADPDSIRIDAAWRRCVAAVASGLVLDRRTLPTALIQRYAARVEGLDDGSAVALAALQADEREAATTVARCELADAAERAQVTAPHEAAFVATYRSRLVDIGDAIRMAEAALPTMAP